MNRGEQSRRTGHGRFVMPFCVGVCLALDASASDRPMREERQLPVHAAAMQLDLRPIESSEHELTVEDLEFSQISQDRNAARWFEIQPAALKQSVDERAKRAYFELLTPARQQEI